METSKKKNKKVQYKKYWDGNVKKKTLKNITRRVEMNNDMSKELLLLTRVYSGRYALDFTSEYLPGYIFKGGIFWGVTPVFKAIASMIFFV